MSEELGLLIKISADVEKAANALEQTSIATAKLGVESEKTGGKMGILEHAASTAAGMLLRDFTRSLTSSFSEALKLGGSIDTLEAGFERMKGGVGDEVLSLDSLRQATKGTVSDVSLLQAANQALALGLPVGDLNDLFTAAMNVGHVMGRTTLEAVQDLTTGIGRQSKLILDNLGIIVDTDAAYEAYAATLGKTAAQLTDTERKAAFQSAAIDALNDKNRVLEGTTSEAQLSQERFAASIENTKTGAGSLLAPLGAIGPALEAGMPAIGTFTATLLPNLIKKLGESSAALTISSALAGESSMWWAMLTGKVSLATTATYIQATAQAALNAVMSVNPIFLVIAALAALVIAFKWAYDNVEPFRDAVDNLADFLRVVFNPVIEAVGGALNRLGDTWGWLTGSANKTSVAIEDNTDAMVKAAAEAADGAIRQKELNEAYTDIKPKIDAVTKAEEDLETAQIASKLASEDLKTAQRNLQSTIDFVTGAIDVMTVSTEDAAWSSNAAETAYGNLETQLSSLQGELSATTTELSELNAEMDAVDDETALLRLEQLKLRDAYEDGRISAEDYKTQNSELEGKLRDLQITSAELKIKEDELREAQDLLKTSTNDVKDKMDLLKTASEGVKTAEENMKTASDKLLTATGNMSTKTTEYEAALKTAAIQLGLTEGEVNALRIALMSGGTEAEKLKTALDSIKSKTITITTEYTSYEAGKITKTGTVTVPSVTSTVPDVTLAPVITPPPQIVTPNPPTISEEPWGGAERFALQRGFEGIVTKPTSFLAGEAGPEYVSVTPRGQPTRSEKTVIIRGPLIQIMGNADEATARLASDLVMKQLRKYV